MKSLSQFNYWNGKVSKVFAHSAQAVLNPQAILNSKIATGSCGQGSCNCGGGCNGECAGTCDDGTVG